MELDFPLETLFTAERVCEAFSIDSRTLGRWIKAVGLEFPEPITIQGRIYFKRCEISEWLLKRGYARPGASGFSPLKELLAPGRGQ